MAVDIHAAHRLTERYCIPSGNARRILNALQVSIRSRRQCVFLRRSGSTHGEHRAVYAVAIHERLCIAVYDEEAELIVTVLPPEAVVDAVLSQAKQLAIRALLQRLHVREEAAE